MAAPSESSESAVRRRRVDTIQAGSGLPDSKEPHDEDREETKHREASGCALQTGTYWLTRIVLLRATAFIYCEATLPLT